MIYQTYASAQEQNLLIAALKFSWSKVHAAEGANDGVVSRRSQAWTDVLQSPGGITKQVMQKKFPFAADHYNQVGWWHIEQYRLQHKKGANIIKQMRAYEDSVKQFYLGITKELASLET